MPSIIIKYEDIIINPEKNFLNVLKFLQTVMSFNIDQKKYMNTLKSIKFNNVRNLENKIGFDEKLHGNFFFRKGLINEWRNFLPKKIQNKIEKIFNEEMEELGYL